MSRTNSIRWVEESGHHCEHTLDVAALVIGGDAGCDVRIDSPTVAGRHALVWFGPDGWRIRALGDAPLLIDGASRTEGKFDPDTDVRLGGITLKLHGAAARKIDQRIDRLERLREQIHAERVRWRSEYRHQAKQLETQVAAQAKTQKRLDQQSEEVAGQKRSILSLRRRLIQRWKKHWSGERIKLQEGWAAVLGRKVEIESQRAAYEENLRAASKELEAEKEAILQAWEGVTAETAQVERERQKIRDDQAELQRQLQTIRQFERERSELESAIERRKLELNGLTNRVSHERGLLAEAERKRTQTFAPILLSRSASTAMPVVIAAQPTGRGESRDVRPALPAEIERFAMELGDQRSWLVEQIDTHELAKQSWLDEQRAMLHELEALANDLQGRERNVQEQVAAINQEQQHLQMIYKRLEHSELTSRIRHQNIEADLERLAAEVDIKHRSALRIEQHLKELQDRWQEQRQQERKRLHEESQRGIEYRRKWQQLRDEVESQQAEWLERRQALECQALVVEQAKEQLGLYRDRAVVRKRIERLTRHLEGTLRQREEAIRRRDDASREEQSAVGARLEQQQRALSELVAREEAFVAARSVLEMRFAEVEQQAEAFDRDEKIWATRLATYEAERGELMAALEQVRRHLGQRDMPRLKVA